MEDEKKQKRLGDGGYTFAPRSCATMGPYSLSKLNISGLSARKWTKLLMMMLHGRMEGSCLLHSMTMYSQVWTLALPQGQLVQRWGKNLCLYSPVGTWPVVMWVKYVTNFIWSYLYQIFDDSYGLKTSLKPLRRPFDRYQSHLEAINNGWDIKQIN